MKRPEETPVYSDGGGHAAVKPGGPQDGPLWAEELGRLCARRDSDPDPAVRRELRDRIWLLVGLAMRRYLRIHRARAPWVEPEDIEDLSSQKTLELVERIVSQAWEPSGRTAPEIAAYISTSARNALTDRGRNSGRQVPIDDADWGLELNESPFTGSPASRLEDPVAAAEFARDLLKCLGALQPRSRFIWFFRAFYGFSSREIAAHPRIRLEIGHVDVLMQRTRNAIRECLKTAGYDESEIPAGVYARVWDASRSWGLGEEEVSR